MSHTDAEKEIKRGSFGYSDFELYKFMFGYAIKYKKMIALILLNMALFSLVTASGPLLLMTAVRVFDEATGEPGGLIYETVSYLIEFFKADGNSPWVKASAYGFSYLMIQAIAYLLLRQQTLWIAEMGLKAELDIRLDLFAHLQELDLSYHDKNEVGRIMSRLTSDLSAIRQMLGGQVIMNVSNIITVIVVLIIVISIDPVLSLIAIISIPLVIFIGTFARKMARPLRKETRRTNSILMANIGEQISGIKVTKSSNREERNIGVFEKLNRNNFDAAINADSLNAAFFPTYLLMSVLGTVFTIYFGGLRVIAGIITIAGLIGFLSYNSILFRPVVRLGQFYQQLQDALTGAERVKALFDTETKVPMNINYPNLPPIKGEVEFKNLDFAYIEDQWIYKDFNLHVKAGETIALVGKTGAGKSTIINILSRMYKFQNGDLLIDGYPIEEFSLKSYRDQIATVPQDFFLFSTSIKENLKLGNPLVSEKEMWKALERVGLKGFIERMPDQLETPLHERGGRLSVGQRQLLVFATILIANPRILILDEATSSVDLFSELLIQKTINLLLKERTAFIIAHRLTTIRKADRILVIEEGNIVESGTHEELLAKEGKYYELVKNQIELTQIN